MKSLSQRKPNSNTLHPRLVALNSEMMPHNGQRFEYLNAVRNGQTFRICVMKSGSGRYIATTATGLKTKSLVLKAYGSRPSEAFEKVTRQLDWNLRQTNPENFIKRLFPRMEVAA